MAKKETKLTNSGEEFIRQVCQGTGNSLLSGNNGPLPYSDDGNGNLINKTWNATPKLNNKTITTNRELGDALIFWFNKYAKDYNLDPNILAAQAYIESGYKIWNYNKNSTASGINQFTMPTIYGVIINNFSEVTPLMSTNEISKIILNLESPLSVSSYKPTQENEPTRLISIKNRGVLHQNVIDNPEIMIKAQARYMRFFSNNCDKLASTSLFCYSRGSKYMASTYSRAIEILKNDKNIQKDTHSYLKEGLDYVLKVFGVLGDKNNKLFKGTYKPKRYYFGYDEIFKFNNNDDLSTYPNNNFDPFEANKNESEEYNIDQTTLDNLTIARDSRYKFIYFPENQYIRDKTNKIQIVLHHTVSGDKGGVSGDIKWWRYKGERVATAFIISRDGGIYQLFNTDYWAYHLGLTSDFINSKGTNKSNEYLNEITIGVEIDSWGGLIQYTSPNGITGWYPTIMDSDGNLQSFEPKKNAEIVENVQLYNSQNGYPNGFRGFHGFEKYTTRQINAVNDLILSLNKKYPGIDLTYKTDMWDVSTNALNGISGVWTHVSYRDDKSDCHPQPELINMLKELKKSTTNTSFLFDQNYVNNSKGVNFTNDRNWLR